MTKALVLTGMSSTNQGLQPPDLRNGVLCQIPHRAYHQENQTAEMRRGAEMESEVTVEYSKMMNVNYSPLTKSFILM